MTRRPGRRAPLDLSLYLVTDAALCAALGVEATVAAAVGAGVTAVQLRDPQATDDELVRLGRAVRARLAGTGVPLLVNDRVHLVAPIGADGAHVGQGDLDVAQARALLGEDGFLGLSVQTTAHVEAALAHGIDAVDYLGVGPVWATATKPDHAPPGGVDALRRIAAASPWPCVAIGGITAGRLPQLRAAGAAGVAVVSAICGQPDVRAATAALRARWDGARA
ncbi:thiamine phosphate synthase [Pengzhenrongella sicca]|uniref:Thiamine-phosphate synthase n=1 Tax=Pengzhenrongella sicca TaxID=2819238 RepID=A0A8A4ZBP1_9MICO|nr:thiamine phosphate synthase [Pengzhenrongella sicca]QTE27907.1 thiamine phosphate synthase [Pengzhenrongella sicca]